MSKEQFLVYNMKPDSLMMIKKCNDIIDEYQAQGLVLTLRQLYYQTVVKNIIENTQRSYKNLGELVNKARLAGLMDWRAIEDRTRNLQKLSAWATPEDLLDSAADQYREDLWRDQPWHVEVWVEKEALVGAIADTCDELRVTYLACRGYTSVSELYAAGKRFSAARRRGQRPIVLHMGDHDPSGLDMTRDNGDRTRMLARANVIFERLALNRDQIDRYNPPSNPAKLTDSRFGGYAAEHGDESWELDALEPRVLNQLIRDAVAKYRDDAKWTASLAKESENRSTMQNIVDNYDSVVEYLKRQ